MSHWDQIVRRHGPGVYATAWRVLGDTAETERVVQDVFRRAHEITELEGACRCEALLRRLTADAALHRLRRRPPSSGAAGRLRSALALLPAREAAAFVLRYFDALSLQEVAEALLLSRSAVTAYLDTARGRLEALLAPGPSSAGGWPSETAAAS